MEEQKVQANQRPTFLTVLCILTFIGSGLGLLFGIVGLVAAGAIESIASYVQIPGLGGNVVIQLLSIVLVAGSLFGAIQMWKLKKLGFYIYAISNTAILVITFSILSFIFTALFIVLYFLNFKHMK